MPLLLRKRILVFFCLCCFSLSVTAQQLDYVQGELLVQLSTKTNVRNWIKQHQTFEGRPTQLQFNAVVSKPMRILSLRFDFASIHEIRFLQAIRKDPNVELAQFNHFIKLRSTIPNDPLFNQQWQYVNTGQDGGTIGRDFDLDLAWDITTGGVSANGDTIVVCIIDDGLELNHNDLGNNIWVNKFEIPNNGVDDDNNGFIDDFQGWNTGTNTDNVGIDGSHGTPVTGIVGALGNNGLGVAGVNWNVQLMIVHGGSGVESEVLEAYSYPLTHRMRYNETNGTEGAFVVATNASWGVDNGFPEDAPIWCAYYDTLGQHGILNCGATTNEGINVDEDGDLPTTCPSDFLISVTNVDRNGALVADAGYGAESIDLAAYGEETFTIALGNTYDAFGGTSASTPHVAGAIALLYAVPCPAFMDLVEESPSDAALFIKDMILQGVDPESTLDGLTLTGGRMNINNSMQLLFQTCGDCPGPLNVNISDLTDTEAQINWTVNDSINQIDLRWRNIGGIVWNEVTNASSPYLLTELNACTGYEFQLKTFCNLDTLDYSESTSFKTDGCCVPPTTLNFSDQTTNTATASWTPILAAESYTIRIREGELAEWQTFPTNEASFNFENLMPCTNYEIQVQTVCTGSTTAFGPTQFLLTLGCGACTEANYCVPVGNNSSEEWIERVLLNTMENISGSDDGYGDYTNLLATQLSIGETYSLELEPGFPAQAFNEYFLVWIDYDQDGNFESDEIAFDPGDPASGVTEGTIDIPNTALTGNTRMRVVMQFNSPGGACSLSGLEFGEMEDYCIEIIPGELGDCNTPVAFDTTAVNQSSVEFQWDVVDAAVGYALRYKQTDIDFWTVLVLDSPNFTLQNLNSCEEYEAQIRSSCAEEVSAYSSSLIFTTDCITAVEEQIFVNEIRSFPNPFHDKVNISFKLNRGVDNMRLQVFSTQGQRVLEQALGQLNAGNHVLEIEGNKLPAGLYLLRLEEASGQNITQKLLKKG